MLVRPAGAGDWQRQARTAGDQRVSRKSANRCKRLSPPWSFLLPPKVGVGDTVEITLRLRNVGSRPMDFQLPGRPVAFDIAIVRPDGTEVWRRLAKGVVGSALMLLRLEPGGIKDFVVQWPQVDNAGLPVGHGTYVVRGTLPTEAGQLAAPPRDLLIERPTKFERFSLFCRIWISSLRVDRRIDRHARAQRMGRVTRLVHRDLDRNPLHHLGEVSGGVVRR